MYQFLKRSNSQPRARQSANAWNSLRGSQRPEGRFPPRRREALQTAAVRLQAPGRTVRGGCCGPAPAPSPRDLLPLVLFPLLRFYAFHDQGPKRTAGSGGMCNTLRLGWGLGRAGGQGHSRGPGQQLARPPWVQPGQPHFSPGPLLGFRSRKQEVRSVLFRLCSFSKANTVHVYK